jgi:hypothetical protein
MCYVFVAQASLDVAWSVVTCLYVLSKCQPSEVAVGCFALSVDTLVIPAGLRQSSMHEDVGYDLLEAQCTPPQQYRSRVQLSNLVALTRRRSR